MKYLLKFEEFLNESNDLNDAILSDMCQWLDGQNLIDKSNTRATLDTLDAIQASFGNGKSYYKWKEKDINTLFAYAKKHGFEIQNKI